MKIERVLVPETTIEVFAELHGLTMCVSERGEASRNYTGYRYSASFRSVEIRSGGCLISLSGNGNTEEAAISNYAQAISEKPLVIDAYKKTRKELDPVRFVARGSVE